MMLVPWPAASVLVHDDQVMPVTTFPPSPLKAMLDGSVPLQLPTTSTGSDSALVDVVAVSTALLPEPLPEPLLLLPLLLLLLLLLLLEEEPEPGPELFILAPGPLGAASATPPTTITTSSKPAISFCGAVIRASKPPMPAGSRAGSFPGLGFCSPFGDSPDGGVPPDPGCPLGCGLECPLLAEVQLGPVVSRARRRWCHRARRRLGQVGRRGSRGAAGRRCRPVGRRRRARCRCRRTGSDRHIACRVLGLRVQRGKRGAPCDDGLGIVERARDLESFADQRADQWDRTRTPREVDRFELVGTQSRAINRALELLDRRLDVIGDQLPQLVGVDEDVAIDRRGHVDGCIRIARQVLLRLARLPQQLAVGLRPASGAICPEVLPILGGQLGTQPAVQAIIEVIAAEILIAARLAHDLETIRHSLQDSRVEGASAEVVHGHELPIANSSLAK